MAESFGPTRRSVDDNERSGPTVQKRLIALLEYIGQVEKLNRSPAFVVPTEFYCAYEEELRELPGVEFDVASVGAAELDLGRYTEHRVVDPYEVAAAVDKLIEGPDAALLDKSPFSSDASTGRHERTTSPSLSSGKTASTRPPTQSTARRDEVPPCVDIEDQARALGSNNAFSDEGLRQFLDAHGLESEDNSKKGGALWVLTQRDNKDVVEQFRAWGFQFKPDRGWWRK